MSDTDGWYSTEGDEHGEVPVAFQDEDRIEIAIDQLWEEEYQSIKESTPGTTVTIRSREDEK
jgi:hypothetical protein